MEINRIFITGDTHGDFKRIRDVSKKLNTTKEDVLIILGDCGFNYYFNERDNQLKNKIAKYPITIFAIRGNHEARPQEMSGKWHYEKFFGNRVIVEDNYPNIKYALDGYDYYIPYYKYYNEDGSTCYEYYHAFVIGGAYSVDKYHRINNGWPWFENEQLNEKEKAEIKDYIKWIYSNCDPIEIYLTHTCPCIYEPTDLFLPQVDQSMVDKSMERFLGEIEFRYPYKAWFWGHYHANRNYPLTEDGCQRLILFDGVIELEEYMNTEIYNNLLENKESK